MRPILIIGAMAALSLTTPVSAQGVDQTIRQQLEQLRTTMNEGWNTQNVGKIASLYTKDAVLVTPSAKVVIGPREIEQNYKTAFDAGMPHHDFATVDPVSLLGTDTALSVGEFHLSSQGQSSPTKINGHWTAVYVREGGTSKIRLLTALNDPPPTSPAK